jgi:hypothetical protein
MGKRLRGILRIHKAPRVFPTALVEHGIDDVHTRLGKEKAVPESVPDNRLAFSKTIAYCVVNPRSFSYTMINKTANWGYFIAPMPGWPVTTASKVLSDF